MCPKHDQKLSKECPNCGHLSKLQPKSAQTWDTSPKCDQKVWTLVQNVTKKCLNIGHMSKMWPKSLDTFPKCNQKVWILVQNEIKKFGHLSKMWPNVWTLQKWQESVLNFKSCLKSLFFHICGPWRPWLTQFGYAKIEKVPYLKQMLELVNPVGVIFLEVPHFWDF